MVEAKGVVEPLQKHCHKLLDPQHNASVSHCVYRQQQLVHSYFCKSVLAKSEVLVGYKLIPLWASVLRTYSS